MICFSSPAALSPASAGHFFVRLALRTLARKSLESE